MSTGRGGRPCGRTNCLRGAIRFPTCLGDGSEGDAAKSVRGLKGFLEQRFGIPVHLMDERLSSFEAIAPKKPTDPRLPSLEDVQQHEDRGVESTELYGLLTLATFLWREFVSCGGGAGEDPAGASERRRALHRCRPGGKGREP